LKNHEKVIPSCAAFIIRSGHHRAEPFLLQGKHHHEIAKINFYVSGTYYHKGNSNTNYLLMYPFPVGSVYGKPDSIFIFNLTDNNKIEFEKKSEGLLVFKIEFQSVNEIALQISYKQELLGHRAEYILETTRSWREPLFKADYQLIIPDSLKISRFSILPDDSHKTGNEIIYYWTRTNYMPLENMVFEFEKYSDE
jgi:hypothetical protein